MRHALPALLVFLLSLAAADARAQNTTEDRLRDAVKKLTADLRAAQEAQRPLQQKLGEATRQRDALQSDLDAAKTGLAQQAEAAAAAQEQLQKLQAGFDAAHKDNAALQAGLAKWQAAYKEAAGVAQAKDAEAKQLSAGLKDAREKLDVAKQANTKLVAAARDILHLYETQSFRALLLKSYEPVLGLHRAKLENMVQDYEDRIEDGRLSAARPLATPAQK